MICRDVSIKNALRARKGLKTSLLNPYIYATGGGGGGPATFIWNSATKGPTVTLSGANLIANTNTANSVRGSVGRSSGTWQFEITLGPSDPTNFWMVGIGNASAPNTLYPGGDANGIGYYAASGAAFGLGGSTGWGVGAGNAQVLTIRWNAGTGVISAKIDGVDQGPASYTITGTLFPMVGDGGTGAPGQTFKINTTILYPYAGAGSW